MMLIREEETRLSQFEQHAQNVFTQAIEVVKEIILQDALTLNDIIRNDTIRTRVQETIAQHTTKSGLDQMLDALNSGQSYPYQTPEHDALLREYETAGQLTPDFAAKYNQFIYNHMLTRKISEIVVDGMNQLPEWGVGVEAGALTTGRVRNHHADKVMEVILPRAHARYSDLQLQNEPIPDIDNPKFYERLPLYCAETVLLGDADGLNSNLPKVRGHAEELEQPLHKIAAYLTSTSAVAELEKLNRDMFTLSQAPATLTEKNERGANIVQAEIEGAAFDIQMDIARKKKGLENPTVGMRMNDHLLSKMPFLGLNKNRDNRMNMHEEIGMKLQNLVQSFEQITVGECFDQTKSIVQAINDFIENEKPGDTTRRVCREVAQNLIDLCGRLQPDKAGELALSRPKTPESPPQNDGEGEKPSSNPRPSRR